LGALVALTKRNKLITLIEKKVNIMSPISSIRDPNTAIPVPEITADRRVLINAHPAAAKDLFANNPGAQLDVEAVNSMSTQTLECVLMHPAEALDLFSAPWGLSNQINKISPILLKLILENPDAAKRLYGSPDGLSDSINAITLNNLEQVLKHPKAAGLLFSTPNGLNASINNAPAELLELLFTYPSQASSLNCKPDFDIQPFLSVDIEKLKICLQNYNKVLQTLGSVANGVEWEKIKALSLDDLHKTLVVTV
jgi:hypothetical protein